MRAWLNRHPLFSTVAIVAALLLVLPATPALAQYFANVFALDGSAGAPSYAFNSATNTGMFRNGNSNVAFAKAGAYAGEMSSIFWKTPGQITGTQTTAPVLSSCTGCSLGPDNTGSTDQSFKVNMAESAASTFTITFANAYTSPPACFAQNETTNSKNPMKVQTFATSLIATLNAAAATGDRVNVLCMGNS